MKNNKFVNGGGEMGGFIRAKDWAKTSLGVPELWPQSLRTTLSIILNSKFPMFLWWGPDLICFYNDAYRPSLGENGKHPSILGMPAKEAWTEIWDIIKPLIDKVISEGESTWSENQLIPIYRNGKIEDVYWTFSYSPVYNEPGQITGVLVTCSETTEKVTAIRSLEESNRRYLNNMMQAPVAMCILEGPRHIVEIANPLMLELWGKTAVEVTNKPLFEGLPEAGGQGFEALLDSVFTTGEKVVAYERAVRLPRNGRIELTYINFTYEALKDPVDAITGIVVIASDVTLQVLARKKVEESEERFRRMAEGTDILIVVTDETGSATYFNKAWIQLTGRPLETLLNLDWADLLHPEDLQEYLQKYRNAFDKNTSYQGEFRVMSKEGNYHWLLSKGTPRSGPDGSLGGYINSYIDITDRKEAEAEKLKLTAIIEASSEFIGLASVDTSIQYVNPAALKKLGWNTFDGRKIIDFVYPGDRDFANKILQELLEQGSFQHEIRFWNEKTGEPFWLQWNGITIRESSTGEITGLATVSPDITERRQTEQALKESEQKVRAIVENSPFPIGVYVGDEMIIELANQSLMDTLGKGNNVIGKSYKELMPELSSQMVYEQLDKVLATGTPFHARNQRIDLVVDGNLQPYYFNYSLTPLYDTAGKVYGVMNTGADISDLTAAKRKIEENEEKLNIVIDASELGTWELDLKNEVMNYSARYLEIFGKHKNDILTHSHFFQQIHPDDIPVRNKAFKEALDKSVLHYEARFTWDDNSIHWVDVKGKVFYDKDNQPLKLIGTVRDITDQKSYQKELEESEQKFRLLADSMPQHIWTAGTDGKLNYCNKSFFDYSGLTPEQINTEGWLQIVHPDDREDNSRAWSNALTSGKDFLSEHRFQRYDGEYRWQLSRAVAKRDAYGDIQIWVGTSTDIQEIKELDQQKDLFISMASHELKTPITSIKGYVQLLQAMYLNTEDTFLNNSLKIIDKQIVSLTGLIADLLDLSKIKSGSLVLNKENFPLNELILEVVKEIKHINPGYQVSFAENTNALVYADRQRIGQVLINFLTNAVKYSPNSSEIKVYCTANDNAVIVSVQDSGIGINKSDQEKIFERFYRVEGKNEKTFPGFGIGLFISAEIIKRHKGNIGVTSEYGQGSVFYFSLPFQNNIPG